MKRRNLVFTLLKLVPFICLFGYFIVNSHLTTGLTANDISSALNTFSGSIIIYDNPLHVAIDTFLRDYFGIQSNFRNFLSCVAQYEIGVVIAQLMFNVLLFLPNWIVGFFEKEKSKK